MKISIEEKTYYRRTLMVDVNFYTNIGVIKGEKRGEEVRVLYVTNIGMPIPTFSTAILFPYYLFPLAIFVWNIVESGNGIPDDKSTI